jgi:hypothetical protein
MDNRKTILFLAALFLVILIIGMIYLSFISRNIEAFNPYSAQKTCLSGCKFDTSNNKCLNKNGTPRGC